MKRISILIGICFMFFAQISFAQSEMTKQQFDSLKRAIVKLDAQVEQLTYNLSNAKRTLKAGVFIATIGYTVTIIGGQLLGVNPELGEALLYTGGAIGIGGTVLLVRGFNKISLGPVRRKKTELLPISN